MASSSNESRLIHPPSVEQSPSSHRLEPGILPMIQNIVCTCDLVCKLDLMLIAKKARNAEYNPKTFAAVIMRIRNPKTTALIFASGKIVGTGAKSEEEAKLSIRKFGRIIQKISPAYKDVKIRAFKIQNMVSSVDVKFAIRLEALCMQHHQFAKYNNEIFPGLVYSIPKPKMCLLIFCSGKVVLTGGKTREDIYAAFQKIYPILKIYRKK